MSLVVLPTSSNDSAADMAIDMTLLRSVPPGSAMFRHYTWTKPTLTFGYTQRIKEVQAIVPKTVNLCRRPTGGGIVDHRCDWTYTLILNHELKAASLAAIDLYEKLHQSIQKALAKQSVDTQLAPCPRACGDTKPAKPSMVDQCFVHPVANDVLNSDGNKIAGAAMKRTRQGILIQGSIDRTALPKDLNYENFSQTLVTSLADVLELGVLKEDNLPDYESIQKDYERFIDSTWTNKR